MVGSIMFSILRLLMIIYALHVIPLVDTIDYWCMSSVLITGGEEYVMRND